MSSPTTNAESVPIARVALNESMTFEEMRKIDANLPGALKRPKRAVQPNMLSYTDGEGAKKAIWMPKGTMHTACKHLEKEDWDALAKFPLWSEFTFSFCKRLQ
jgi:hypothetical protein